MIDDEGVTVTFLKRSIHKIFCLKLLNLILNFENQNNLKLEKFIFCWHNKLCTHTIVNSYKFIWK